MCLYLLKNTANFFNAAVSSALKLSKFIRFYTACSTPPPAISNNDYIFPFQRTSNLKFLRAVTAFFDFNIIGSIFIIVLNNSLSLSIPSHTLKRLSEQRVLDQ